MMIGRLSLSIVACCALLVSFSFDQLCKAQSVPTPAPTYVCPSEVAAWHGCLQDNNLDGQECADCYNAYHDLFTNTTTCEELTELICNQIGACTSSCGTCGSLLEAFETCQAEECFLGCSYLSPSTPTFPTGPVTPAPTPTAVSFPTAPPACDDELNALIKCSNTAGVGLDYCNDCMGGYLSERMDSCEAAEFYTCEAMEACPECRSCDSEHAAMDNCLNGRVCDSVTCPAPAGAPTPAPVVVVPETTPAPSVDPCQVEIEELWDCIRASGGETVAACDACVINHLPESISTCEDLDYTCSAREACPECGSCEAELNARTNCYNEGYCDPITCPASAPTGVPTLYMSTSDPVSIPPSPVSAPKRCPSELDGFQDCIATELSSTKAAGCEACVQDALKGFLSISRQAPSCGAINSALCPILAANDGECGCGACTDELQQYASCSVDALTTGCELACGGGEPTPAPTPPSTSGAARCRCHHRFAAIVAVSAGSVVLLLALVY